MKKFTISPLLVAVLSFSSALVHADVKLGAPAPAFELSDQDGKMHSLKEFTGKMIVLEWLNFECPFVRKHYDSGNMQKLQAEETSQGAVWLSIISSAKGKQGHFAGDELKKRIAKENTKATLTLVDEDGKVGRLYGAKTTPHLFILGKDGKLAYKGAIDTIASTETSDIPKAKNYVRLALEELRAGKAVSVAETESYGCSVKYGK